MPSQKLELSTDYVVPAGVTLDFVQDNPGGYLQPIALFQEGQNAPPSFTNNGTINFTVSAATFDVTELFIIGTGSLWTNAVVRNNGTIEAVASYGSLRGLFSLTWTPGFVNTGSFHIKAAGEALG